MCCALGTKPHCGPIVNSLCQHCSKDMLDPTTNCFNCRAKDMGIDLENPKVKNALCGITVSCPENLPPCSSGNGVIEGLVPQRDLDNALSAQRDERIDPRLWD